ncbi:ABC transporter ATP-binding protein/permease [Paracoccaceae bacterium]|nr:ABC transporter ATP-binding protein/permease [Paracoccaceae bacterium]
MSKYEISKTGYYSQSQLFKWIWSDYLKDYKGMIIIAIILMIIEGSTFGLLSYFIEPMFDQVFAKGDHTAIKWVSLSVAGIFILRAFSAFFNKLVTIYIGQKVVAAIQKNMIRHLLTFSPNFFQENSPGSLIERVRGDTAVVERIWATVLAGSFRDLIAVFSLLIVAISIDPIWAMIALLGAPLLVIPVFFLRKLIQKTSRNSRSAAADLATRLDEIFHGISSIKLINGEKREHSKFANRLNKFVTNSISSEAGVAAIPSLMDIIAGIGFVGVLTYGGYQIIEGTKTVGEFMSFFTAIALLFEPIRRLGTIGGAWQTVFTNLERIRNIFDLDADIVPSQTNQPKDVNFTNDIKFDNVHLSVNEKDILRGITFTAQAEKTTAIVGPSGAGKTTLFNLIGRLIDPDKGNVGIGNISVKDISLEELRHNLSYVSQDSWLFDESIEENIKIGNPNASPEDYKKAIISANANDFIDEMPNKEKTPVGPRGSNLSGGQRQRIAIARAILRNTPILLLDEPTSALDNEAESQITKTISSLSGGRTTLIIAHKISTIKDSDHIIVLDNGLIIDQGTHSDLIDRCETYKSLYEIENR